MSKDGVWHRPVYHITAFYQGGQEAKVRFKVLGGVALGFQKISTVNNQFILGQQGEGQGVVQQVQPVQQCSFTQSLKST